jgi:hemolysin activation/secretion protein
MLKPAWILALTAVFSGCAFVPAVSFAQQPVAETPAPRFDINRFEIKGATLVPAAEIDKATAPFTGKGRDFGDIQRALEAIEQVYRRRGWGIVQVLLPEQDITRGAVELRIIEPRVGRVVVEGNQFYDVDNIRRSLPSVKEGTTPNSREMSRNLQMLSEHPTKQTAISLRGGASEDQVDVNVRVIDEKPWRLFFTLDNTGTSDTGYWRSGVGYQHSNLWNDDHIFTAQYITSPTKLDKVTIFGAGYRIPFYHLNSALDLVVGYSDVDSGTVQGLLNVTGSGLIGAVRWTYYLPKLMEFEQKVAVGLDYRAFTNKVTAAEGGTGLVPDITIHPLSITYSALRRFASAELSFYVSASQNIPGGSDGHDEDFACPRASDGLCVRSGADPKYSILRFGGSYAQVLPREWQLRFAFNAQQTRDALVPGELFGVGGPDSVRGYAVREISNDRGYQGQVEVYTPDVAKHFGIADTSRLRFLGFYDFGSLARNKPLPGEVDGEYISSVGLGLRYTHAKNVSLRVDVAQRLRSTPTHTEVDGIRTTAALAVIY